MSKRGVHCKMYKMANSGKLIAAEEASNSSKLPNNVPAFLVKLWTLVNDPKTDNLVCWSANGKSFIIKDQARFEKELLPYYYKHNHMASFVRQLNMYGFHKKVSAELGGLKCDKDEMEFAHEHFCMGRSFLLVHIKRKIASNKNQDTEEPTIKSELMKKMLTEVRGLKGRQEQFDYKLALMKNENTLLWKEFMMLRQKHVHQQEIVNKLIHFLVTLVQSRRGGLTVKRRLYPLMIDNSSRPRKKSKLSEPQASPTGPVIHELCTLEPGLDSKYIVANMMENEIPSVQSPESIDEYVEIPVDEINENIKIPHSNIAEYNTFNQSIDTATKRTAAETRKTKVPIKILIPPLQNGGKPREELHLLEMPDNRETLSGSTVLKNDSIDLKPVPVATLRSSKLAAMAASMKKSQEDMNQEFDTENSVDTNDDISDSDTANLVNFENLLTNTNVPINDNTRNNIENKMNVNRKLRGKAKKELNHIHGGKSVLKNNNNRNRHDKNVATKSTCKEKHDYNKASASSSKDLSLSCVNSSGPDNYREEFDDHLGYMQVELENIHDVLRGDNYKIDANTLFGLFNNDEPVFGISDLSLPATPDLNQEIAYEKKQEEEEYFIETENELNRGEVMTYSSNIDFDHLLSVEDPTFSLMMCETNTDPLLVPDSLDLEDVKTSFFDSSSKKDMNIRS